MKALILLSALVSLTLVSCGGKKNNSTSNTAVVEEFSEFSELQAKFAKHTVICSEVSCPGYVAKLVLWFKAENDKFRLGVCSGTLYKNKYIITNSHCIPDEVKYDGANCSKYIKVLFPQTTEQKEENATCSQVIQVFDNYNNEPDIAVIELNTNIYREDIKIVNNAFIENSTVHAYTMNPSADNEGTVGKIKLKTCKLTSDNIFTMSNELSSATTMLTGDNCNVIGGNSGSGLFNEKNEYIGAVYAKIEMGEIRSLFTRARINNTMYSYNGSAYNIGCLNSITEAQGYNCDMRPKTMDDLNSYIEREKAANGLSQTDEANIKYQVLDGFKLNLTKGNRLQTSENLVYFKLIWKELFVSPSSSSTSKITEKRLIEAQ